MQRHRDRKRVVDACVLRHASQKPDLFFRGHHQKIQEIFEEVDFSEKDNNIKLEKLFFVKKE